MKNKKLEEFLEKSNAFIKRQEEEGIEQTPELSRKALSALMSYTGDSLDIRESIERVCRTNGREIPVRIYHPAPDSVLPVMLFFHGGGHMCGNIEIYDPVCRRLSINCNCVLVSVEYRLAPDNPYPDGLDDCRAVLKEISKILEGINADATRIVTAGDSAGGAMTATLSSEGQKSGMPALSGQILIYPSLDYTKSSDSYIRYGSGFLLETSRIDWYFKNYFRNGENYREKSPLFMDVSEVPPTLIISAEHDPLSGDSEKYAARLEEYGIQVEFHEYPEMIHAFLCIESIVPDAVSDAYSKIASFFRKVTS